MQKVYTSGNISCPSRYLAMKHLPIEFEKAFTQYNFLKYMPSQVQETRTYIFGTQTWHCTPQPLSDPQPEPPRKRKYPPVADASEPQLYSLRARKFRVRPPISLEAELNTFKWSMAKLVKLSKFLCMPSAIGLCDICEQFICCTDTTSWIHFWWTHSILRTS